MVLRAKETSSVESERALSELCRIYWHPLYAFLRRQGQTPEDAEDLTQGFFATLLEKKSLRAVDRDKGKFRSFLLAALRHFVSDEWDKARAAKRGGGKPLVSIDEHSAEALYLSQPDSRLTPERMFDRRWALALLGQAFAKLREEFASAKKVDEFDHLKVFLSTPTTDGAYDDAAAALGISADAVAVKVHRLRQRYRELIRDEVAQTVASSAEIEEEMQYLFAAVGA